MATTFTDIVRGYQESKRQSVADQKERYLSNLATQYSQTQDPQTLSEIATLDPQRGLSIQKFQAQQQNQRTISDYLDNPTQEGLSRIATQNPQAAQTIMKFDEMKLAGKARKVKSMYNTWKNAPPSRKKALYDKWRKDPLNQEDMSDYPLAYDEQTAQQIAGQWTQDNRQAQEVLGEQPVSPEGKLGYDIERGFVSPQQQERLLQEEQPVITDVGAVEDLEERAKQLENAANQNYTRGKDKIAGQQMQQARFFRTKKREEKRLVQKDVTLLSKEITKAGLGNVTSALKKAVDIANATDNIPGFGIEGKLPSVTLSKAGQEMRQTVRTLGNAIVKMRSGAQVTDRERAFLFGEIGVQIDDKGLIKIIPGTSDRQLRIGLENVAEFMKPKVNNIYGGFRPEATEIFDSRAFGKEKGGYREFMENLKIDFPDGKVGGEINGTKWRVK